MANPSDSSVQNLLPVQAYFDVNGNFQTFIGQGQPFTATIDPDQSGLHITNSTIDSSVIGGITPAAAHFTTATVSTQPSAATDVVNLLALQSYAAGISWKQPCVAATLTSITLSGLQDIDGHTVVAGDRVLVKNQGTASQNGIYLASASTWTRASDADTWNELICAISFIEYGTQAGGAWFCTAQAGGTIDVTANNWAQFTTSATYSAGTGLTLSGTQFSITPVGTAGTYGSASTVPVFVTNASGQVSSVTNTNIAISATQMTSGTIDSARLSGSYTGITGLGTLTNLSVTNTITGSISGNAGTASIASNLALGASGSLPYQTASNTTAMLAKGNDGQILSLASGLPTWIDNTVGTVTAVTASAPLASSGGTTPNITITQAGTASNGYLSSTDWNTFNGKANSGANSDITSMTGLTGGISSPNYIAFNTGYSTTLTAGQLGWDGNNTLGLGMSGGNVIQHIGEDQFFYCKASSAITKGQVVMFTGAVGASGVPKGAPATGITDGTYIMGVAAESISLNGFGLVQSFGTLRNVDTSGYADGDILWYNPSVTGGLTKTKPSAPNVKAQIAAVINGGSSGGGTILIRINAGSTLGGTDSNAQITSPSNGQIITYDGTATYWKNTSLTAGTGISISAASDGTLTVANTVTAGISITDNTSSSSTYYPTLTTATSGTITGETTSSTKFSFVPSTGILSATGFSGSGASLTALSASNISAGTLAIAYGGTNGSATPTAGAVPYGTGTAYAFTSAGTSGQVLQSNGASAPSWVTPSSGAVVQVKSTTKTSIFSTTATSYTDITGLSVSITPTSASNKILVFMTLTCGSDTATVFLTFRLVRGSTAIDIGDAAGSRTQSTGAAGRVNDVSDTYSINAVYLDSPATTSSTTYKVQMFNNNGNTCYVGSNGLNADNGATGRYPCTITVMEVTP